MVACHEDAVCRLRQSALNSCEASPPTIFCTMHVLLWVNALKGALAVGLSKVCKRSHAWVGHYVPWKPQVTLESGCEDSALTYLRANVYTLSRLCSLRYCRV